MVKCACLYLSFIITHLFNLHHAIQKLQQRGKEKQFQKYLIKKLEFRCNADGFISPQLLRNFWSRVYGVDVDKKRNNGHQRMKGCCYRDHISNHKDHN